MKIVSLSLGFVKLTPNIGIVVNHISPKDLLDILNIRQKLETYAISLAAQKSNEKDIDNLKVIIQQMEKAVFTNDTVFFNNLNAEYHRNIINISDNKKLIEICDNLHQQSEHWIKAIAVQERLIHSFQEHIEIYSSLREKRC